VILLTCVTGGRLIEMALRKPGTWYSYIRCGRWTTSKNPHVVHISPELKELINGLIKPESERWTMEQVKQCKFMKVDVGTATDSEQAQPVQASQEPSTPAQ
jgi:hypothetical protein